MNKLSIPLFSSRTQCRGLLPVLLVLSSMVCAEEPPTIVNTGEATVFAALGQVEFLFVRHFTGATLEESVAACQTFLDAAPEAIRGSELQPVDLKVSPPLVTSTLEHQTRAVVTVRFGMAAFNAPKTGPAQFAGLCDKLAVIAEAMKATLSSPEFEAAEKDVAEAAAVSRATENAYLPAEAIAQAVKSTIFAIDNVELLELLWEQQPDKQTGEVPQLGCRAKVRVSYALSAQ